VFTGVDRVEGERISDGDVLIPLVDVRYHLVVYHRRRRRGGEEAGTGAAVRPTVDYARDYVWNGAEMGMMRETALGGLREYGVDAYCPGLDSAVNCHPAVANVGTAHDPRHDAAGLHRSADPGAGAFSPYHNCTTVATSAVPAGGELFKSYGDDWFLTRPGALQNVPLGRHYDAAQRLVDGMDDLVRRIGNRAAAEGGNAGAGCRRGALPDLPRLGRDLYVLMASSPFRASSRALNALPAGSSQLEQARKEGIRSAHRAAAARPLSYLRESGRCLDGIRPGRSAVRQAGRGAFARRPFARGDVVAGTPLLVCDAAEAMTLYEGDWRRRSAPPREGQAGKQVALNYCHQHPSSPSLFLCPYGHLVNYINHPPVAVADEDDDDPTGRCSSSGGAGVSPASSTACNTSATAAANVEIRWARDGEMGHNASWFELSPASFDRASPGLFWDYVATRDIQEGDEIYLDYGPEWERAWSEHVRS
jgi:hypothetical protein